MPNRALFCMAPLEYKLALVPDAILKKSQLRTLLDVQPVVLKVSVASDPTVTGNIVIENAFTA